MVACLSAVGLFVYFFTESSVFWPGFFSMLFFYALIFLAGSLAGKVKSSSDDNDSVMLAGRSLPLWIGVFTMSATWIGGGYINGSAEATYSSGLVWLQAPWGYAMSLFIGGLFFARTMRRHEFKTMLDPLEQRYGERVAALFFLPALSGEVFWTAAILSALGSTFGVVLGLDFHTAIIVSALITIAYTALGGLWAVALTDVVQMILLLVGLLLTVPFALETVGGWDFAWSAYVEKFGSAASLLPSQEALGSYYWNWWDYALLLMLGGIPWQVYFQRVLAAKDERTAQFLSFFAGFVCLLAAVPSVMIGIIGNAADWSLFGGAPENSLQILPYVMKQLTPGFVAVIGLGAISAAVMSSADSSILSSSSMAGWNVYRPLFKPGISPQDLGKVIKKSIWIIGIAATLIALQVESIYALWFLCSDFVYCLLFPALVCALFDKKTNKYGAMAGLAIAAFLRFGGGDTTLGIPNFLPYPIIDASIEITDGVRSEILFPFRTMAMLSGLIFNIVISRLTERFAAPTELRK